MIAKSGDGASVAAPSLHAELLSKIELASVRVGIIGLGYVGLPLARAFGDRGIAVLGFDVDPEKVTKLARGQSYIGHIPDSAIREMQEHRFEATTSFDRLSEPDVIIVCVPTPLTDAREPDLTYIVKSTEAIAATSPPGSTHRPGKYDLSGHHSPGRIAHPSAPEGWSPGVISFLRSVPSAKIRETPSFLLPTIPKVVGGLEPTSLELATAIYGKVVVRVIPVSSPEVAEACKILENTYRAINIALVNELKMLYDRMGINVWEVIEAAKSKPFGFQAFYPGPGLGGHCIPIDPFYLTWVARKYGMATRFIELAGEINTAMPSYVVSRVADALNERSKPVKGSKITLLGMAYKKDVDDPRESPGFELMDLLLNKGALVHYNDPHIPVLPPMRHYPHLQMSSQELSADFLPTQDCLVIVTDHSAYDWSSIAQHADLIVDTRNATQGVVHPRRGSSAPKVATTSGRVAGCSLDWARSTTRLQDVCTH